MLCLPGQPCPTCGQIVYGIDDTFAVQNEPGTAGIPQFRPGLYHYECFLSAPFRDAYLQVCETETKRYLEQQAAFWETVAQDINFALVLKPLADEYTLFFLRLCREISFVSFEQVKEFHNLTLTSDDWLRPTGERFMILSQPDGWTIAQKETVEVGIEFTPADFAKMEGCLGLNNTAPPDLPVDVGRVCKEVGVVPLYVSCPLERAKGLILNVERLDTKGKVLVSLAVDHWKKVPLSFDGFNKLKTFLQNALAKAFS